MDVTFTDFEEDVDIVMTKLPDGSWGFVSAPSSQAQGKVKKDANEKNVKSGGTKDVNKKISNPATGDSNQVKEKGESANVNS